MVIMNGMTSSEAAEQLGIDQARVRDLVASGRLIKLGYTGRSMIIDPASVQRVKYQGVQRGRVWAPHTAWATLSMLSGDNPEWLIPPRRSRIKASVRDHELTARHIHSLARHKDKVKRYRTPPASIPAVAEELVATGPTAMTDKHTAARFGLAAGGGIAEGYVAIGDADALAEHYFLAPDPDGNVVIHEIEVFDAFAAANGRPPLAAIAVDLMDSLATRERSAGERVLTELLEEFRRA